MPRAIQDDLTVQSAPLLGSYAGRLTESSFAPTAENVYYDSRERCSL